MKCQSSIAFPSGGAAGGWGAGSVGDIHFTLPSLERFIMADSRHERESCHVYTPAQSREERWYRSLSLLALSFLTEWQQGLKGGHEEIPSTNLTWTKGMLLWRPVQIVGGGLYRRSGIKSNSKTSSCFRSCLAHTTRYWRNSWDWSSCFPVPGSSEC